MYIVFLALISDLRSIEVSKNMIVSILRNVSKTILDVLHKLLEVEKFIQGQTQCVVQKGLAMTEQT